MDMNQDTPQEELEQKISEAEMEAQLGEKEPEVDASAAAELADDTGVPPEQPTRKKEMSRARKIWRRTLIWLVVIAIAFAGGFYLDAELRYKPELKQTEALSSDLESARAEISSLEDENDRLRLFEEQNTDLKNQLESQETHLILLSARTAVADAALAVEQDRSADARLALDKLGSTLESLKGRLNAEQAEVVDNMLQRHRLILIELENTEYSVDTDLELLATRLISLENNLFASP